MQNPQVKPGITRRSLIRAGLGLAGVDAIAVLVAASGGSGTLNLTCRGSVLLGIVFAFLWFTIDHSSLYVTIDATRKIARANAILFELPAYLLFIGAFFDSILFETAGRTDAVAA